MPQSLQHSYYVIVVLIEFFKKVKGQNQFQAKVKGQSHFKPKSRIKVKYQPGYRLITVTGGSVEDCGVKSPSLWLRPCLTWPQVFMCGN